MAESVDYSLSPEVKQKLADTRNSFNREIATDKKLLAQIQAHYKTVSVERLRELYKSRVKKNIALRDQISEICLILREVDTDWKADLRLDISMDYNEQKRKKIEGFDDYAALYPKWYLYQMWKKQMSYTPEIYENLYKLIFQKACLERMIEVEKEKKEKSGK